MNKIKRIFFGICREVIPWMVVACIFVLVCYASSVISKNSVVIKSLEDEEKENFALYLQQNNPPYVEFCDPDSEVFVRDYKISSLGEFWIKTSMTCSIVKRGVKR